MSLLEKIKQRSVKGKDESLLKSIKIYSLSEPYKDSNNKDLKSWKCHAEADQKIKTFTDPATFKSLDDLCEKLKQLIDKHSSRKRKLNETFVHKKPLTYFITESCMYKCLERCLNEDKFYSKDGLDFLIYNQFVTSVIHTVMVKCIMKYGDLYLLRAFNMKLKESLILELLKYVIKDIVAEEVQNLQKSFSLETIEIKSEIVDKVTIVLSLELDFEKMREQLKLLLANDAITLLQLLRYILFQVSPAFYGDPSCICFKSELTEKMVVRWIDSLISAQMISFATSPIAKPIVEELNANISDQVGII